MYRSSATSAIAASGAASAKKDMSAAPPSSAVEMTKFPSPPVKTVECALRTPVNPLVNPATPPPAITAAVHFTIGGMSVMTAADRIGPGYERGGCGDNVKQVVDDRNVISQDFDEGRHAEHDQGRWRAKPGEAIVQMEMPGIGRAAGDKHRQEDAKAGRSGEGYAKSNG